MLELDNTFGILFYGLFSALVASLSFNVWLYTSKASDPYCSKEQSAEQLQDLPAGWWTDDMRFQAEKRAIFSKVRYCPEIYTSPATDPWDYLGMDLRKPSRPLPQSRRLLRQRSRGISYLPHPGERRTSSHIPQCLPAPRVPSHEEGRRLGDCPRLRVSWLELQHHGCTYQGTAVRRSPRIQEGRE